MKEGNKVKKNLKCGFVSGVCSGALNTIVYFLFRMIQGNSIQFIGENAGSLYILTILFSTLLASVLGSILYGWLVSLTKQGIKIYVILVMVLTIGSSISSEMLLHNEFQWMAHVLHLVVAMSSIYFLIIKSKQQSFNQTINY